MSTDRLAFLCHFGFWFGLVFATPLFIVLNNPDDFTFSLVGFALATLFTCLTLTWAGWKLAALAGAQASHWTSRLLLACGLVMAVQGNVVHELFDYGAFNGTRMNLLAYGRWFWVELGAWLLAFPALGGLLLRTRKLPVWLVLLPCLSFLVLLLSAVLNPGHRDPANPMNLPVESSSFAFSTLSNLVHLVPDGLQSDVVRQVLEENPDLAKQFRGFTLFTDHLGRYPGTAPSVYSLLTGKPFDFEKGWDYRWLTPDILKNGYPSRLRKAGYQLDYVPISAFICDEQANSCHPRPFSDMKARGLYRHHVEDRLYSLRLLVDLSLFRLSPMALKQRIHNHGYWLFSDTTADGSSPWPDPVLREWTENIQLVDDRPVFKWYHYVGTHIPPQWDRDCRMHRDLDRSRANYLAQTYCILDGISTVLKALEAAGIYDQTAIIITGDHGHNIKPDDLVSRPLNFSLNDRQIGQGRPALLAKQQHNREALRFSDRPTKLLDIVPTILSLTGLENSGESVFNPPATPDRSRVFQKYDINHLLTGKAIPYVEYETDRPSHDASGWQVSAIRNFRRPPQAYEQLNREVASGFVTGAQLGAPGGERDAAWILGRQLAFVIELPGEVRERRLEITLHSKEWIPRQSFSVQLNHGQIQESEMYGPNKKGNYWRSITVPLSIKDQITGTNFVSVLFEQEFANPDKENWYASALLKSIRVVEVD